VGAGPLATNGAVKVTSASSPTAPMTVQPACPAMLLGAEAAVLAAEAWEARMQAVPLPHVA
jgi:hypothetical protein